VEGSKGSIMEFPGLYAVVKFYRNCAKRGGSLIFIFVADGISSFLESFRLPLRWNVGKTGNRSHLNLSTSFVFSSCILRLPTSMASVFHFIMRIVCVLSYS